MERRFYLRIKKNLETAIYTDDCDYTAHIIDISQEGLAFETEESLPIEIGTSVTLMFMDHFQYITREDRTFVKYLKAYIKNISLTDEGKIRYGCAIKDIAYSKYVEEQVIALACGTLRNFGTIDDKKET